MNRFMVALGPCSSENTKEELLIDLHEDVNVNEKVSRALMNF